MGTSNRLFYDNSFLHIFGSARLLLLTMLAHVSICSMSAVYMYMCEYVAVLRRL